MPWDKTFELGVMIAPRFNQTIHKEIRMSGSTAEQKQGEGVVADGVTGEKKNAKTGEPIFEINFGTFSNKTFREAYAKFLEEEGYEGAAQYARMHPNERHSDKRKAIPFDKKVNYVYHKQIEVRDVLLVVAGALVIGMVWEGVRYAFKNKFQLPGFFDIKSGKYIESEMTTTRVRAVPRTGTNG